MPSAERRSHSPEVSYPLPRDSELGFNDRGRRDIRHSSGAPGISTSASSASGVGLQSLRSESEAFAV